MKGYCMCKQITYEIEGDPVLIGYDHCDTCQRQTGSAYSLVAVCPRDKVTIHGTVKKYSAKADSGNDVERWFCGNCGSPIAHVSSGAPELLAMKAGTLAMEDKKQLKPTVEIYTQAKLPFIKESLEHPFHGMPS